MLIIYSRSDIAKYVGSLRTGRPVRWLYLGSDYIRLRQIEQQLGDSFSRIDISRLHEDVAYELRKPFMAWMDDLNARNGAELDWWFGAIASRNVYRSNLYQYTCYLELLRRILKGEGERPSFIVVQSYGLMEAVVLWIRSLGMAAPVLGIRKAKWDRRLRSLREYTNVTRFIARSVWYEFSASCTRLLYGKKIINNGANTLIDTFILDNCLSKDGIYKDRYFPGLSEYMHGKGMDAVIHPVLCVSARQSWAVFQRMRCSSVPFIIQEDFLMVSDYFSAVVSAIRISRKHITASKFLEFDMMPVLEEERKTRFANPIMEAVLAYRLYARFGQKGIKPKTILKWYENQAIDKAVVAGARAFMPGSKVVGAQMYVHTANQLNLFPSKSESDYGLIPDELLQMSERQCKMVNDFSPDIRCRLAASLRYVHIFQREQSAINNGENDRNIVTILLPGIRGEAAELMDVAMEGLASLPESVHICVKMHPSFGAQHPRETYGIKSWPKRFGVVEGSIQEVLRHAAVVISSNSVTMVEAAALGIPVIFVARQTALNINPLDGEDGAVVTKCYSPKELHNAVQSYLNHKEDSSLAREECRTIRVRRYFTEINGETIKPYASLC